MGAAPTKTEQVGTAKRSGSGECDGKVYECRNQWWKPLKSKTDSNLVDMGRIAVHVRAESAWRLQIRWVGTGMEAMGKVCGVPMAMLQGKSWAPHPSNGQQ